MESRAFAGVTMRELSFPINKTIFTVRQGLANAGMEEFTHSNAGTLRVSLGVVDQPDSASEVRACSTSGGRGHHPVC